MTKKRIIYATGIIISMIVLGCIWNSFYSPTRIAFINYQVISLGEISKSNDNSFIKISELATDDIDQINRYDMVFINGMGLRITEAQREIIQRQADKGLPVLTTSATNPDNNINTLDSINHAAISKYISNGGRKNYRSLLNYVRLNIDKKKFSTEMPQEATARSNDIIYHSDIQNPDNEDLGFNSIKDYHSFLNKNGMMEGKNSRIIITGQMGEPTDLIKALEKSGNIVYPVRNIRSFMQNGMIDSIQPSAVINMAHGRMGDYMVDYLKQQNIPLFSPLNVNTLVETWEENKMGMSGGFLSQSVVMPEIDGAIRPFALFAHYKDSEGLHHAFAIPERVETFVKTVNNYISLQNKPNADKRVAIYYYKGAGQNALTAGGMEVGPSLFNLLLKLKEDGYYIKGLPSTSKELEQMIQSQGAVFGNYAKGAFDEFMANGNPELITKQEYESWVKQTLRPEKYAEVVALNGEFPGEYMSTEDGRLGVARLQFGNVVLLPQNAAGAGENSFKVVHGTDAAPPHTYIASYLWTQFGFKADVMIHFGTHGSLEFTPRKQVALSSNDWPDRLVGVTPHLYVYSIGNVGEGVIAKRRSYAGLQSYLTPPFLESNVNAIYRELTENIKIYNQTLGVIAENQFADRPASVDDEAKLKKASLNVKSATIKLGIHRELELDSTLTIPYSEDDILRIENFAEELNNEKITGQLYSMGIPYEPQRIVSSVYAMSVEPVAYSLLALDKTRGRINEDITKHKSVITQRYINPSKVLVGKILENPSIANDELICKVANITTDDLAKAREIEKSKSSSQDMMAMMMSGGMGNRQEAQQKTQEKKEKSIERKSNPHGAMTEAMKAMGKDLDKDQAMAMAKTMGASPEAIEKMRKAMQEGGNSQPDMESMKKMISSGNRPAKKEYSKEEINLANAIMEIERTINNISGYKTALSVSPQAELNSMTNAMNGGYTAPSPGGDPIVNPNTLPTGRNLYSINAEATPSESAWEKGIHLANKTIEMYKRRHNDSIPRKVSYTLWSGEFIETEGATIAQILYMLGVEPIRDAFGRVSDLRLIPSEELGRPRIDVVVQTSGQLRDIAASRLFLINRAVEMAATATNDEFVNMVNLGVIEAERTLIEKGLTPKDAREISTFRVFGGANGGYGTGIQGMVMAGDRWENEKEIAEVYINNMGAYYGNEKNWEMFRQFAFEAALTRTDAVIQPRQSNTWGALSLDHVFEFMGGLNLAVRNVTGKDPDAYLSDYRNRNNVRIQEVKESIGIESRTTIFNPTYISEKMKGEAGSANVFAEIVQNTYGWNVMKPSAIDNEMWDEIYNVYVKDKFKLNMHEYFGKQNPAALEEITAVMMESARKGIWRASDQQLSDIAALHTQFVNDYKPSCSGFVCDNAKLRQFIASKTDIKTAERYSKNIRDIREAVTAGSKKSMVMKKEELNGSSPEQTNNLSTIIVVFVVLISVSLLILLVRNRKKQQQ